MADEQDINPFSPVSDEADSTQSTPKDVVKNKMGYSLPAGQKQTDGSACMPEPEGQDSYDITTFSKERSSHDEHSPNLPPMLEKVKKVSTDERNRQEEKQEGLQNQANDSGFAEKDEEYRLYGADFGAKERQLATKALNLDNIIRILSRMCFDCNKMHPSTLKKKAEEFLASFVPSIVKSSDGFDWISVTATNGRDRIGEKDLDGLEDAWDSLNESGETINFKKIQELAVAHGTFCGKWMIFKDRGVHVDLTWERVFRATTVGRLGISAKVSTNNDKKGHVICVYNKDFTNKAEVMELESRLRDIGIRCRLTYKPDVFTYLGVYSGNEWGIRPVIHTSEFELQENSSKIVSLYD